MVTYSPSQQVQRLSVLRVIKLELHTMRSWPTSIEQPAGIIADIYGLPQGRRGRCPQGEYDRVGNDQIARYLVPPVPACINSMGNSSTNREFHTLTRAFLHATKRMRLRTGCLTLYHTCFSARDRKDDTVSRNTRSLSLIHI